MRNKEQQLRHWARRQKRLIAEAVKREDREYLVSMWMGFLNGLRLTNAIEWHEYNVLYDEVRQYANEFEVA